MLLLILTKQKHETILTLVFNHAKFLISQTITRHIYDMNYSNLETIKHICLLLKEKLEINFI